MTADDLFKNESFSNADGALALKACKLKCNFVRKSKRTDCFKSCDSLYSISSPTNPVNTLNQMVEDSKNRAIQQQKEEEQKAADEYAERLAATNALIQSESDASGAGMSTGAKVGLAIGGVVLIALIGLAIKKASK